MTATVIVALAGIFGTLAGPWIQARQTARHAKEADLRNRRIELYVEATTVAQAGATSLDWLTDEYRSGRQASPEISHSDLITPRMRLLAPKHVRDAWAEFLHSSEVLAWNVREKGDHDQDGLLRAFAGDQDVLNVRNAIERLHSATRADLGIRSD